MTRSSTCFLLGCLLAACGDDTSGSGSGPTTLGTATASSSVGPQTGTGSDSETSSTVTSTGSGATTLNTTSTLSASSGGTSSSGSSGGECADCDAPNEFCVEGECVQTCQGQDPDPCQPAQVCDVITGMCVDPGTDCSLAGPSVACGEQACGPGTACDDQGQCVAVAPCAELACLNDGSCWGTSCACIRQHECASDPDPIALAGPFSGDIGDLEFEDDCTAWMVTLRSGVDFVRRITLDGTLTEWAGVANLNMGEVKVLKALTPPPGIAPHDDPVAAAMDDRFADRPLGGGEPGEVAITYTCCSTCGCQADPPQGVARLDEANLADPLPIVIVASVTQGVGPYGNGAADAGPHGLTWGEDRVLYVGNSTQNGNLDTADLDAGTTTQLTTFGERVTAGAAISPVHLLVGTIDGTIYRYNTETNGSLAILDVGSGVTSLSHDAFDGTVYAGLADLRILAIDPFAGTMEEFGAMPSIGRVTVSPNGQLWFVPVVFAGGSLPMVAFDLPSAF